MFDGLLKKIKENFVLVAGTAILALIVGGAITYVSLGGGNAGVKIMTAQVAGQKVIDYINNNYLKDGEKISLTESVRTNNLYKIKFSYKDQENEGYVTMDGKLLFPVGPGMPVDLEKAVEGGDTGESGQKTCEEIKKSDQAFLEAFVVSQCPYGLQMQRVLAETIKNIPALKNSVKVKYIGSIADNKVVSMHGEKEAEENLRQICIREETDRYWDYVSCYMKKGESDNCMTLTGINKNNISACAADGQRGLKYAKADFDSANIYGATGSPTLIFNQEKSSEFWFGGRTAEAVKTLICCGFQTKPGFCSQALSQDSAASGFSESYKGSSDANQEEGCE